MVKGVPQSSVLSTASVPSWATTISYTIERSNPLSPDAVVYTPGQAGTNRARHTGQYHEHAPGVMLMGQAVWRQMRSLEG